MAFHYASLNSGSNANCYYAGTKEYGILIDAGLGLRQFKNRMAEIGLSPFAVKAIFISHEHTDHIRALPELAAFLNVPVFLSEGTYHAHYYFHRLQPGQAHFFKCGDRLQVNDISIECFYKNHDGADPHSFVLERNGLRLGVFTDIGEPCAKLSHHFGQCHIAILEANYDDEMLANGPYPYFLKRRIAGRLGHLSNQQALQLYLQAKSANLRHLILGHLSKQNNTPEKVAGIFAPYEKEVNIYVASRYDTSPLFFMGANACFDDNTIARDTKAVQLSLF